MKVRVRFGIKLSWPIKNAAILVFYLSPDKWQQFSQAIGQARAFLPSEINDRLVCEKSN